jgi:thioredoxin 1
MSPKAERSFSNITSRETSIPKDHADVQFAEEVTDISIAELTDKNFDDSVKNSKTPIMVDFWAVWCGPCRKFAPIVEELAKEYKGKLSVAKLNVDKNRKTAEKFEIKSIPTILIFKEGKLAKTIIGYQSKEDMKKTISSILETNVNV